MTTQTNDTFDFETWKKQFKEMKKECDVTKDWRSFWSEVLDEPQIKEEDRQEAINGFADTICCALEKMDGKEVCECMFAAVTQQFEYTLKEHNKSIELLNAFVNASEKK